MVSEFIKQTEYTTLGKIDESFNGLVEMIEKNRASEKARIKTLLECQQVALDVIQR